MALEAPTMEQAGLVSVVVGAGAAWFGLYVNSTSSKHEVSVPAQTGSMPTTSSTPKASASKQEAVIVEDDSDDLPPPARRL